MCGSIMENDKNLHRLGLRPLWTTTLTHLGKKALRETVWIGLQYYWKHVQYLGLMFKKTSDLNKHIKGDLLGATEQEYSGWNWLS